MPTGVGTAFFGCHIGAVVWGFVGLGAAVADAGVRAPQHAVARRIHVHWQGDAGKPAVALQLRRRSLRPPPRLECGDCGERAVRVVQQGFRNKNGPLFVDACSSYYVCFPTVGKKMGIPHIPGFLKR
eukprot:gene7031-biopygen16493